MLSSIIVMTLNIEPHRTETDKMDRNPPIKIHKHDLWTFLLDKVSLFSLSDDVCCNIFGAVKNETVCLVLNFRVRVLLESALHGKSDQEDLRGWLHSLSHRGQPLHH